MSKSPESWLGDKLLDFRAPPPSPITIGRRPSLTNESILAEFLRQSLKVPGLVLPDKIVPTQKLDEVPPTIDFELLTSPGNDVSLSHLIESVDSLGCFELINHGISNAFVVAVMAEAGGLFELSKEKKAKVKKSLEKIYGFEEKNGADEDHETMWEEFVWGREQELESKMEGIWPRGYSNFSGAMEILASYMEKIGAKILQYLEQHNNIASGSHRSQAVNYIGSVSCIYKHNNFGGTKIDEWARNLKYDFIRMLIRGCDYSHALGIHICDGCSEFHVYSKKGWTSFVPQKNALVITLGDQIQTWTGGQYKHAIGKPIFRGDNSSPRANMTGHISMSFLYSPHPTIIIDTKKKKLGGDEDETIVMITIGQQLYFAMLLTLAYQFLVFLSSLF